MNRARKLVLGALLLMLCLAGALIAFGPLARAGTVEGVDVSNHQGPIDWKALAADNVHFAYIKATEGETFLDQRFATNWANAKAAGLFVGAYHFFTLCRPGIVQAAHFVSVLPPYEPGILAPAVDLEHMGPCRKGPTMSDVETEAIAFLDHVERGYGRRPIIYITREFHDAHLRDVAGEQFWLRSLFRKPGYRQREWISWQHHNRGAKRGIAGPIDINAFRGDRRALAAFANSSHGAAR
jgi:lysozyme